MTKRYGSYNTTSGKKPKLDEDELWDDDFDEAALDKCFELASQVDSNLHNGSAVPDYNAFKNIAGLSSSTQLSHLVPATSTNLALHELEAEIQKLKQTNSEKCGEISILRSKLREATTSIHVEQQKTTNEWREKLLATEKELKTISSNLEFKNLEIGNLKQQLTDLRKVNQETQPAVGRVAKIVSQQSKTAEIIQEPIYPLKAIPTEFLTVKTTESHIIKIDSTKNNSIRQINSENSFNHKCPEVLGDIISLEMVFTDIVTLINCNAEELNSPKCRQAVHKIVSVALIMLHDFDDFLKEFGRHLRTEDIQQFEVSYLLNESLSLDSAQFGSQVGQVIQILSIILLYNWELAEFVCIDKPLKLEPTCWEYAKLIPHRNGFVETNFYFLNLIHSITNHIGKYRLTRQSKQFILSVINFLKSIQLLEGAKFNNNEKRSVLFTGIFKEIVFLRPGYQEIAQLTFLLKVCSCNTFFLKGLFKKDTNTEMLKANQKGVLSFNNNVCCFCVLAILLQNYLQQTEKLELNITCNILSFICNSFESSHWIHHDSEENVCVCSSQLYKIGIEFIFRELGDFVDCYQSNHQNRICPEWSEFLNHKMVQTVLSQISFNNYELVEKYVMVLSQFKEIEEVLKQISDYDIPQLNTSEETPEVSYKQFNKDF